MMNQINLLCLLSILCTGPWAIAQNYAAQVFEYKPAPGQFINNPSWGSPAAAQSILGGINGGVSLGAYGGYIVVGFDQPIQNDPLNPYDVDFTIFGNPLGNTWAEPGIVQVMKDENGNGLPDDIWYELKGSDHDKSSTVKGYAIQYLNPGRYADVPWRDNLGRQSAVLINGFHQQPYYPDPTTFPNVNAASETYSGTLIEGNIDDSNSGFIKSFSLDYGYADNHPRQSGDPVTQPDDPSTVGILEGAGGDAMKLEWAIDAQGNPVLLDEIHFVKIYNGVNAMAGWLGEVSTEIQGLVDVSPLTDATINAVETNEIILSDRRIVIYKTGSLKGLLLLYDVKGKQVLKVLGEKTLESSTFSALPDGIYLMKDDNGRHLAKIIID